MKLQPQILSQRCTRDRYLGLMVLLLLGTTGGCSWLREPAKQPLPAAAQPLERARAYTRDFPDKALGWQERATLELTAAGGDIPGLSRSIERAHALAQPSL